MLFSSLGTASCGSCFGIYSSYPCDRCCGDRGVVLWSSTHQTDDFGRDGGAVFMRGSQWVCLLRDVAEGMHLLGPGATLAGEALDADTAASEQPESGAVDAVETTSTLSEFDFPMPAEFSLS